MVLGLVTRLVWKVMGRAVRSQGLVGGGSGQATWFCVHRLSFQTCCAHLLLRSLRLRQSKGLQRGLAV